MGTLLISRDTQSDQLFGGNAFRTQSARDDTKCKKYKGKDFFH